MPRRARPQSAACLALALCLWATPVQGQSLEPVEAVSEDAIVDEAGTPPEDVAGIVSEDPVAYVAPTVSELIVSAAWRYGLDANRLLRIARCESQLGQDRNAYRSDWHARGVFQFTRATWQEQAPLYGFPWHFDNAFDDALNVELAATLMSRGQWGRWACK